MNKIPREYFRQIEFFVCPLHHYNEFVKHNKLTNSYLLLTLLFGLIFTPVKPGIIQPAPRLRSSADVTAFELIAAMNSLRVSNGLPALIEDPIIDAVAQSTAQTMAANEMSSHIGNISGRLASSGYGNGATVFGTENFAMGFQSIDQIMQVWSDPAHMLPAVVAAYCNVGAGTAISPSGMTYYILQAAYTSGKSCGSYTSGGTTTTQGSGSTSGTGSGISQYISPIKIASPDADGKIFHIVQAGQTFWSIAIAYKITIRDIKTWNNLADDATLKIGEKLFIPGSNTAGYATPTQVGAIQLSTPDASGKIIHIVQAYQTLSTIAQAYGTTVNKLLGLNNLQVDTPLRIGQALVIQLSSGPTLQPLQSLTPASDGKYYHTVQSGETILWIAQQYSVKVGDLLSWNGLSPTSIIHPGQKLLLRVTPPASSTPTALPASATPLPPTASPQLSPDTETPAPAANNVPESALLMWAIVLILLAGVLALVAFFFSRKR